MQEDVNKVDPRSFLEPSLVPTIQNSCLERAAQADVGICQRARVYSKRVSSQASAGSCFLCRGGEQPWLLPVTRTKAEERADS